MDQLSALLVIVPEAEPLVGRLRAALDPAATLGVPAHVTIMAPFVPAAAIDDAVLVALHQIAAAVPAFDVWFPRVEWFADNLFWLAPEPAAPFVALTQAVRARFGLEPYEGKYGGEIVPHLTIGSDAAPEELQAAAARLTAELADGPPVRSHIKSVRLMTGLETAGSWRTMAEFSLLG